MSEHAWVQENLAAHLAGGLSAAEAERLEQHAAACSACAAELARARDMDRKLEELFTGDRPGPALEDHMIQSLRKAARFRPRRFAFYVRAALGAAAVLFLGVSGAFLSARIAGGQMRYPWEVLQSVEAVDLDQNGWGPRSYSMFVPTKQSMQGWEPAVELKDANELAAETREKLNETPVTRQLRSLGYLRGDAPGPEVAIVGNERTRQSVIERQIPPYSGKPYTYRDEQSSSAVKSPATATTTTPSDTTKDVKGSSGVHSDILPLTLSADDRFKPTGGSGSGGQAERNAPEKKPASAPESTSAGSFPAQQLSFPGQQLGEVPPKASLPAAAKPATPAPGQAPPVAPTSRKIIRSGDIEFEVESFDAAVAIVTRLIGAVPGGFIATVNSDKLPNGKVRGTVVVRVPPDRLDGFVLDLRRDVGKAGELKGQRIGSQDITKQYTDLESRLRAARAMEERLLQIIKTGKGEIKDLLQVEKELGIWRTRIEEYEGELRFYANQVALSTLNITLYERAIRAATEMVETERVQMGIEVEDVDKVQREVQAAVAAAKGRITRSELKQHGAGQYNAVLHFEVAPESAGPVRDRLKQLGEIARLEVDRLMQNEGGTGRPPDGKVRRSDTVFQVSLYNLTNVAPRQTVQINLACVDVESAYQAVSALGRKEGGRVVANINRQRADQVTASVTLEVRTAGADPILRAIKEAGEVLRLQSSDNPDAQNSTRSKRGFVVQFVALWMVEPRATETLKVAARDVPAAFRSLQEAVALAKGRVLRAQLNEQDRQNIVADFDFDVRRSEEAAVRAALAAAGAVYARTVNRATEGDNKTESKVRLQVQVVNVASLKPRETVLLGVEVTDVDRAAADLSAYAIEAKGRTAESHQTRERNGRVITRLVLDVPLASAPKLVDRIKAAGILRTQQSARDPQVPEGDLATARLDVTLSNTELIVPSDQGLLPRVRQGLTTSFVALSWSLTVVIVGLFFVLPWVMVIYISYRVVLRLRRRSGATPTSPS